MELHQLKYFIAVSECLNFSKAALKLDIAQSSLSIQISKLEQELGVRLFERYSRSLVMTTAAKELIPLACGIVKDVEKIYDTMSSFISADKGHIRVGAFPGSRYFGITDAISSFKKENPEVKLLLTEAECKDLVAFLKNAEIDVAFFSQIKNVADVTNHLICQDHLVYAVRDDHKNAGREAISLEELAKEPMIVNESSMIYDDIINALREAGYKPDISLATQQISTQLGFVSSGIGGALISNKASQSYNNINLRFLKIQPPIERNIYMGVLQQHGNWPVVKRFVAFMLRIYQFAEAEKT